MWNPWDLKIHCNLLVIYNTLNNFPVMQPEFYIWSFPILRRRPCPCWYLTHFYVAILSPFHLVLCRCLKVNKSLDSEVNIPLCISVLLVLNFSIASILIF